MCRAVGPEDWKSLFYTVRAVVLHAKPVHENHADLSCMTAKGIHHERQKESTKSVRKVFSHVI